VKFQAYVDLINAPCSVLRVEKTAEGECGAVTIHCANTLYKEKMGPAYYDGMPYYELVPKDVKFEDFCFRAAHLGQKIHAYVETKAFNSWTDEQLIPLVSDEENVGYCQFTFEMTQSVTPERMAAVSMDTAEAVIKTCVALLSGNDFRDSVRSVLSDLLFSAKAFACRVVLIDRQEKTCEIFCDILREKTGRNVTISYEIVNTWDDVIGMSNAVIVQNEHDMNELEKVDHIWAESLRKYNVESLILVPLRRGKGTFGYLYIVNFDVERVVELKELVELISYFLSSELSNHLLMKRLENMSNTDPLTGLNNRHAMTQRFESLSGKPFGVISIDLNGLKVVNDTQGHAAGDALLERAATAMGRIFRSEDIYRIGGDEFLIIAVGIGEEKFTEKAEMLRNAQNDELSFSMGTYWSDGSEAVRDVIRKTDKLMYADKKAFYKHNPAKKRERRG